MSRIFECKETMPPTSNSPDVVRTALSPGDVVNTSITEGGLLLSKSPAAIRDGHYNVRNIDRPVRGRPY